MPEHLLERHVVRCDHRDVGAQLPRRRGDLAADPAGADDHDALRARECGRRSRRSRGAFAGSGRRRARPPGSTANAARSQSRAAPRRTRLARRRQARPRAPRRRATPPSWTGGARSPGRGRTPARGPGASSPSRARPRRYSLESGGRWYGRSDSLPTTRTRPSNPSSRSVAAAVAPGEASSDDHERALGAHSLFNPVRGERNAILMVRSSRAYRSACTATPRAASETGSSTHPRLCGEPYDVRSKPWIASPAWK